MFLLHDWEAQYAGRPAIFQYTDCVTIWEWRRTSCGSVQAKFALYSRPLDFAAKATATTHSPFPSRRFDTLSPAIKLQSVWNVKLFRRFEETHRLRRLCQTAHGREYSSASLSEPQISQSVTISRLQSRHQHLLQRHVQITTDYLWVKIWKYPTYSLKRGLQSNVIIHHLPAIGTSQRSKIKGKVHCITCQEGSEGEQRRSSTLSLTLALDLCGWLKPPPVAFLPQGMRRCPLYRKPYK